MIGTLNRNASEFLSNLAAAAPSFIPIWIPIENPNNQVTLIDHINAGIEINTPGAAAHAFNLSLRVIILLNWQFAQDFPSSVGNGSPTEGRVQRDALFASSKTFINVDLATVQPTAYDLSPMDFDFNEPIVVPANQKAVAYLQTDSTVGVYNTGIIIANLMVNARQVPQDRMTSLQGYRLR